LKITKKTIFQDWLPFESSAINAREFISPKALADYIMLLDKDENKYQEHLKHKDRDARERLNSALVDVMESRTWSVGEKLWGNFEAKTLVEEYECFVCRKLHSNKEDRKWIVDKSHYDCPVPKSSLTKNELKNSFWAEQWHQGKYEAMVLKRIAYFNEAVTQKEFYDLVTEFMTSDLKKSPQP
jgi:Glycosyltransferase family 10 (fucosyltransferase) C-term